MFSLSIASSAQVPQGVTGSMYEPTACAINDGPGGNYSYWQNVTR